jgi:hypothetical protein
MENIALYRARARATFVAHYLVAWMENIALYRARARATFLLPQLKNYHPTKELLPVTIGHACPRALATVACCLL